LNIYGKKWRHNVKRDVVILCQYFYPEYVSSATLPTELAIGLLDKGLDVSVVTGFPKEYIDGNRRDIPLEENFKGVDIKRVKYTSQNNKTKLGRLLNFFTLFVSMLSKVNHLRKFNTIIVYSNPPILPIIPYYLKKFFKTKFIFVVFDIYPDSALKMNAIKPNGSIHKVMKFINKRVYKKAEKIVLLGNEMKEYVIANKVASSEENLHVIPNWYSNETLLETDEVINEEFLRIRKEFPFIVLYSGNMGSFQDMETILRGLLHYKDKKEVLFIFCGHGNKLPYVKEFIQENHIANAKVYDFLVGTTYADVLKISDMCVVSLEKGVEGLGVPSKTYGYFAAGKPTIAIMKSATDIAKSILLAECGRNIMQGDVEGFVHAIDYYRNNPDIREKHSINAKKLYREQYNKEENIDKYYEIIIE
jgi:glycosyltransferase involved in cell wall biosynthesis